MVDFDELRRQYEAGNEAALHAAANACRPFAGVDWVTVPAWVIEALWRHNIAWMRELAPGHGQGRTATWAQQYNQDFLHLIRFSEVNRARQQGLNYSEAYKHVAEDLADTPYGGVSADGIRKSYQLVKKAFADPEKLRRRFFFPNPGWLPCFQEDGKK